MKNAIFILCSIFITSCVSSKAARFSGTPGCQTNSVTVNDQPVSTDFCIRKVMFKPSQYLVQVNGQTIFEGTDFKRVAIEKQIKEGKVTGGCDAKVTIQDMSTERPVDYATLPEELTSGCHIYADSNGRSLPFLKNAACDEVFYKNLGPLIGKVFPVELGRQCIVRLDNKVVFDSAFQF